MGATTLCPMAHDIMTLIRMILGITTNSFMKLSIIASGIMSHSTECCNAECRGATKCSKQISLIFLFFVQKKVKPPKSEEKKIAKHETLTAL